MWKLLAITNFGIQSVGFVFSSYLKTEKFYDITGSLTYLTLIGITAANKRTLSISQKIQLGFASLWAIRLGAFLFKRIMKDGEDKRFKEIKANPVRFFGAWMIQGVWIMVTLYPTLNMALNSRLIPVKSVNLLGWSMFVSGFLIETVADQQKWNFKSDPKNKDEFIHTGLWSISRHPNYFGEILLWSGMCVATFSHIKTLQHRSLAALCPLFIAFLITQLSGVPLLEKSADKRWGTRSDYQEYKKNTACLVPYIW